jgi:hypothetical protein
VEHEEHEQPEIQDWDIEAVKGMNVPLTAFSEMELVYSDTPWGVIAKFHEQRNKHRRTPKETTKQ